MTPGRGRFLRDNAFVVAAVALPVVVAVFFLLASVVPQWTVPAPTYDLVLRAARPYDAAQSRVVVDFAVRDGRVEATLRPAPNSGYAQPWALLLFDHETMTAREIPLELPATMPADAEPETVAIEALADWHVSPQAAAPDGYQLQTRTSSGSGLVGDLFGMGRYRQRAALVNRGRIVPIDLPSPYQDPYQSPVYAVGWVLDEGRR